MDHHKLRDEVIIEEEEWRESRGRERAAALMIVVAFVVWGFTCYAGFSLVYH